MRAQFASFLIALCLLELCAMLVVGGVQQAMAGDESGSSGGSSSGGGLRGPVPLNGHQRLLLESESSESSNYPDDAFSKSELKSGAVVLHLLGFFYMFAALAIVCDEFFVPSLEIISNRLNLRDDVAGATFMAAGGSAPELATSFVGTFVSRSDVGFATIVGSAVFNILFVIGTCAVVAPGALRLSAWPLARDSTVYAIDLAVLIAFFQDQRIEYWEALLLFSLYIGYVVLMGYNETVHDWISHIFPGLRQPDDDVHGDGPKRSSGVELANVRVDVPDAKRSRDAAAERKDGTTAVRSPSRSRSSNKRRHHDVQMHFGVHALFSDPVLHSTTGSERKRRSTTPRAKWKRAGRKIIQQVRTLRLVKNLRSSGSITGSEGARPSMSDVVILAMAHANGASLPPEARRTPAGRPLLQEEPPDSPGATRSSDDGRRSSDDDDDDDDEPMDLAWPRSFKKRVSYVILAPITWTLYYTVPDVRREGWEAWFPVSFLGSVAWIGMFSYLMVWWVTVFGDTVGIPSSVMGLTVLAIGTSVPDLLESVIVTKQGKGDMAVSSSIGSNIFDITVGLPIPWLLFTAINSGSIRVGTSGLLVAVILLFGMLVSCIVTIAWSGWRMSTRLGLIFFGLWVAFVTVSLVAEVVL